MADSKLHDMFKLAMWDEHISYALYLATAGKARDKLMKSKLLYLAGDEKVHLEELTEMHRVLCCTGEIELTKIGYPNPAETGFLKPGAETGMEEFLAFAMEKESSALNFYLNMSDNLNNDPKASATMLHFSAMEGDHYNLLKTELENLRRRTA